MLIVIAVLLIILGVFSALFPRTMWWFNEGWKFKDVEPSDAVLVVNRLAGAIITTVGVLILLRV